jgi:hypothetical protein
LKIHKKNVNLKKILIDNNIKIKNNPNRKWYCISKEKKGNQLSKEFYLKCKIYSQNDEN